MDENYQVQRLMLLSKLGFSPRTILDIGAYHGEWTKMARRVFPDSKIYMIEANKDNKKILKNVQQADGYEIALLGDRHKKSVDYFVANPQLTSIATGNSIYMEKTRYFSKKGVIKLPMLTLDEVVSKNRWKYIDFIKLDTQGSELDILKGGKKILSKTEFILLETQNLEYNKDAPLIEEVFDDMKRYGYKLYDIHELHFLPTGELFQLDLLFIRIDSKYLKRNLLI